MSDNEKRSGLGLGGVFKELNTLVDRLGKLAQEGGEFKRTARFGDDDGDGPSGVFGIHVRTGIGREGVSVEPFGNVRMGEDETDDAGDVVVDDVREPMVDVYDEDDHILVVAEMPGVGPDNLTVQTEGDVMTLEAETDRQRYRKELLLPRTVDPDSVTVRANNGIVEVRCVLG